MRPGGGGAARATTAGRGLLVLGAVLFLLATLCGYLARPACYPVLLSVLIISRDKALLVDVAVGPAGRRQSAHSQQGGVSSALTAR